ncbi:hypothetical protein ACFYW6_38675 [Streptomyces sp. NPDC002659]|uniref:hypothetical protein n=1 Tax=Streptomyces sp. NPDC002659 TaxID=3364656 RepID=UPI003695B522
MKPSQVENLLTRALTARAEQITTHSLRPASPPTPNWAARGRAPLILALAAAIVAVALMGTATVTTFFAPKPAPVADVPNPVVSTAPSPPPTSSSSDPTTPSRIVPSSEPARTVTVVYGPPNRTFTLRTGEGVASLTATVQNNVGEDVENASDILTITPDTRGSFKVAALNVSLLDPDTGTWRPVGTVNGSTFEAHLTGPTGIRLPTGESRTHQVRISLTSEFPASVERLRIVLTSDGGGETLTYKS